MLITAFGMFWRRDEVNWSPGRGQGRRSSGTPFELLGRRGKNRGNLQVIDARKMKGVYLLHNDYGTYYVGLAKGAQGLGNRLYGHTRDHHAANWTSFSWFAFDTLLRSVDEHGYLKYNPTPASRLLKPSDLVKDVEAMLMLSLGTLERGNQNTSRFRRATEWQQVQLDARSELLMRIAPR